MKDKQKRANHKGKIKDESERADHYKRNNER